MGVELGLDARTPAVKEDAQTRLQLLSRASRSFAEATGDPELLLQTIVRQTAEALGAYCGCALISDDGQWLNPVAVFERDPDKLGIIQRLAAATPMRIGSAGPLNRALETGAPTPFLLTDELLRARFERNEEFEAARAMNFRSALFTALRARGTNLGCLSIVRHGTDARVFDEEEQEFARHLADLAGLAISNARLFAAAQSELGERKRLDERLQLLSKLTQEFSALTSDYQALLRVVSRRLGEIVGDLCAIRFVAEDGDHFEPGGSIYHPDPEFAAELEKVVTSGTERTGVGPAGLVAITGEPMLVPNVDPSVLAATFEPRRRAFVERLGIRSLMVVPLVFRGKVIGVISMSRFRSVEPYTENDLRLLQDVAAHAALAVTNARLFDLSRVELRERQAMADRLRMLSELSKGFAAVTGDYDALLKLVAKSLGQALGETCSIRMVSKDGEVLEPGGALFDAHPDRSQAVHANMQERPQRVGEGISGRVAANGESVLIPRIEPATLPSSVESRYRALGQQLQARSLLVVALRSGDRVMGVITMYRSDADNPYTEADLRLVEDLAAHASLAIANARLLVEGKQELNERQRLADRLKILSEAAREFAAATGDFEQLIELVVRRVAELMIGDLCVLRSVTPNGEWLGSTGTVYHEDPEIVELARGLMLNHPLRAGEGIGGRVVQTGRPLMVTMSAEQVQKLVDERYRTFVRRIDMRAIISVPLMSQGRVIAVLSVARCGVVPAYEDDDLRLLEDLGAHASLALANSLLLEAKKTEFAERMRSEEVLRRGFLEAAPDAVLIVDQRGQIILINSQAERLFGYDRAELVGLSIDHLVPQRFAGNHPQHRKGYLGAPTTRPMGAGLTLFARRKDDSEFAAEISLSPISTPDGMLVAAAVRDVSERRREMEERNRKMQEANRLKSEFLANMSHELRTPLNAIIGFSALMHAGKAGPLADLHKEYLGDILASSRHLLQLINDVLDLSKIEAGRVELRYETVNLEKVVGEVKDILRGLVTEKRLKLLVRLQPTLADVAVDPRMLKQVLYNFLSNAIKFTPESGAVTLRIDAEPEDWFRIEVEDTGIGIRSEDLERLFVEFQQLDAGTAKKYPGTGLGLALTKRIVEAHGGSIGVRSVFGTGSVFFARLPSTARPARAATPAVASVEKEE